MMRFNRTSDPFGKEGTNRTHVKFNKEMMEGIMNMFSNPAKSKEDHKNFLMNMTTSFLAGINDNSSALLTSLEEDYTNEITDEEFMKKWAPKENDFDALMANLSNIQVDFDLNGTNKYGGIDPSIFADMDRSDLSSFFDLGQSQSTVLNFFANLTMITFIYYIPRMFFFRAMRFSTEMSQPSFIPILLLSIIAMAGATCHIFSFYNEVSQNMIISMLSGGNPFDPKKDNFTPYVWKSLCASFNRVISPIASLVVIQQLSLFSDISALQITQKMLFEIVYCLLSGVLVFVWTFHSNHAGYMDPKNRGIIKEDTDLSFLDVVPPILAAVAFYFMRKTVARKQTYAAAETGPNAPRTVDRVSKVIVFQTVMAVAALASYFLRDPQEIGFLSNCFTFFICAQTPVVQWVLMRSLLRATKSRRLCFLFCCASEERVNAHQSTTELKSRNAKTNENGNVNGGSKTNQLSGRKSNRNNDDDDDDDTPPADQDTQETLDHDKAIHVRV